MASHHHHHPHHQTTTCCCTCNCCHPSPPPHLAPPHADSLLQAMASLLLQQQQQSQPSKKSHLFKSPHKHPNLVHPQKSHSHGYTQDDIFGVLSSLLARIDALEASLHQLSSPPPSKAFKSKSYPSCSLRDAAARVIQTHFRAFLVQRLKTLRQLKQLAIVKSCFNSLKLSISGEEPQFNSDSVYQKALDLLLKLDSIQGGDPMIRDGKESLRRGLVQLLEYINGASSSKDHRRRVLLRASKNVRLSGDKKNRFRGVSSDHSERCSNPGVSLTKPRNRVGEGCGPSRVFRDEAGDEVELEGFHQVIGGVTDNAQNFVNGKGDVCVTKYRNGVVVKGAGGHQPARVKKNVSFAQNGTLYTLSPRQKTSEVSSSADGTVTDESVLSDDHGGDGETTEDLAIAKDMEGEESAGSSDEESNVARNLSGFVGNEEDLVQDEDFMFAAPLPVKMESRADLLKKTRKGVTFNIVS